MTAKPLTIVIDDLFGRVLKDGSNPQKTRFMQRFSGISDFDFYRGQTPVHASLGQIVENDESGSIEFVRKHWDGERRPACLLLDLCFLTGKVTEDSEKLQSGMPEGRKGDDQKEGFFGLRLLKILAEQFPDLPIMILSSMRREDVEDVFVELGAYQFLDRTSKTASHEFEKYLDHHGLLPDPEGKIVGNSIELLKVLREARRARKSGRDIMLRGERGSGKELLAGFIHQSNSENPFVIVSCPALETSIFRSELFGVEPNSATNVAGRIGLVETAENGDLFLDEIGDLESSFQPMLLRLVEAREFVSVGGRTPKKANIRIIAATEKQIESDDSGFRESLLDRFGDESSRLWIPPLRDRKSDIKPLVVHFLRLAELEYNDSCTREVTESCWKKFFQHDWPGNVRELRWAVFSAVERFPDVKQLTPKQIQFGTRKRSKNRATGDGTDPASRALFSQVLEAMDNVEFPLDSVPEWRGGLSVLAEAVRALETRMLAAAVRAGRLTDPESDGYIKEYRMLVDLSENKLPSGIKNSNAAVKREVQRILKNALPDELDDNLQTIKNNICP